MDILLGQLHELYTAPILTVLAVFFLAIWQIVKEVRGFFPHKESSQDREFEMTGAQQQIAGLSTNMAIDALRDKVSENTAVLREKTAALKENTAVLRDGQDVQREMTEVLRANILTMKRHADKIDDLIDTNREVVAYAKAASNEIGLFAQVLRDLVNALKGIPQEISVVSSYIRTIIERYGHMRPGDGSDT